MGVKAVTAVLGCSADCLDDADFAGNAIGFIADMERCRYTAQLLTKSKRWPSCTSIGISIGDGDVSYWWFCIVDA